MTILVAAATGVAALCLAAVAGLALAGRRGAGARELVAILPSLVLLLLRLLRDRSIPLRVRARVLVAVAYNVQPLNLIPDFVPVVGFADNVLVTVWAVRSTVRRVGRDVVVRHWSGNEAGLAMVFRLAGLEEQPTCAAVADSPR